MSIARLYDEAAALRADVIKQQESYRRPVDQKTQWSELELLSQQSNAYDSAWSVQGIQGLTDTLHDQAELARSRGALENAWKEILDDTRSASGMKTKLYLASMHPMLVEALIRGDITKRLYEDEAFATAMTTAELDDGPGTYINILCRRKYMLGGRQGLDGSNKSQWPGYGLSVPELKSVLQDCLDYVRWNDSTTHDLAAKIDDVVRDDSATKSITTRRRFVDTGRSVTVIKDWVNAVRQQIVVPAEQHLPDQPLQRCFYEIGICDNCKIQAFDHQSLKLSNYLFSLVNSVVLRRFPGLFEIKAYQLHRILIAGDQNLSETELTLLGRALYTECGLNVRHGGSDKTKFANLPQKLFDQNAQTLTDQKMLQTSWEHDRKKRDAFAAAVKATSVLPKLEVECDALEAKTRAKADEMMDVASRVGKSVQARTAVLDAIQNYRRSHPRASAPEVSSCEASLSEDSASFVSTEESMALTEATTPASVDDVEEAPQRKRRRVRDCSPEL